MNPRAKNQISCKARLLALDLLRLFAIVLVLGRHMPSPSETWPLFVRQILFFWTQGGWVGVDLFFVLSGFLVSGLLFTEYKSCGHLGVGRFYMRRAWKIYPPFFTLIGATLVLAVLLGWDLTPSAVISEIFFIQNYVYSLWNHTWSLAIEEHFYILLPLTLWLILRFNQNSPTPLRPIVTVAVIVAVITLGLRLLNWYLRAEYEHLTHLLPSHLRFDSLFFGVVISYAYHFHHDDFIRRFTPWRRALIVGGVFLLAPAFVFQLETSPFIYTFGLSIFYIGSGMLLVGALLSRFPSHRLIGLLAKCGAYSYSIYLWHMPVLYWGIPPIERMLGEPLNSGARMVVYFSGTFCVGIMMAKVVEVPMLRIRDRWFPSGSARAV